MVNTAMAMEFKPVNSITQGKEYYVRDYFISGTRPHAAWRIAALAAQPDVGLLPQQRTWLAGGHSIILLLLGRI